MTTRREFVKALVRFALLALAAFAVVLGIRRQKIAPAAQAACEVSPGCQGCGKLAGCSNEQAEEFKQESKQIGQGN